MSKIDDFLNYQRVNSIKDNTIKNNRSKLEIANTWKPLDTWEKEDVTKYIIHMKDEGYAESYIEMTKSLIKSFFKWIGKEDFVKDIKVKMPKKKLRPSEIWTPDEIDKLIKAATDNRWKALIALLYESGARISELLNIRVSDIQEQENGMVIHIPATKTGEDYRPCLCVMSGQYIRNHVLYPPLKPDCKLFDVSKPLVWLRLKEFAKAAGIAKPISAHPLRHAQATYMVRKGYNESIIRSKLGWTDDSKMIARYVSIDGQDVINATLEKEGGARQIPKELVKPIKIAEPIAIADKTIELNRLNTENEELKQQLADLAKDQAELRQYLSNLANVTGNVLMKTKPLNGLKDYPEEEIEEGKEWQLIATGEIKRNKPRQ
jgi:integrase/recombinase XerD